MAGKKPRAAKARQPTTAPLAAESTASRRTRHVAIAAFLALQIAIPLRYYLGTEPEDERFSWRMFSAVRLRNCSIEVFEYGASGTRSRVRLGEAVHKAWEHTMERGRQLVIAKFLRQRCQLEGAVRLEARRHCDRVDGTAMPEQTFAHDCRENHTTVSFNP